MISRAALLTASTLLFAGCSTADATTPTNPDFTCSFTHPSKSVTSLRRLPSPIRKYIKEKAGRMADRGQFFNAGDVVTKPAPFDRFIRGGKIAGKYFLWYEHGGFAYWKQIVVFDGDLSRGAHPLSELRAGGNSDLCAQTDGLLGGG